jgi:hypothetical protein
MPSFLSRPYAIDLAESLCNLCQHIRRTASEK